MYSKSLEIFKGSMLCAFICLKTPERKKGMKNPKRTAILASMLTISLLIGLYVITSLNTRAAGTQPVLLLASDTGMQNSSLDVELEGFIPGETVVLWQTFPNYQVLPLEYVRANSEGKATVSLHMDSSLPVGKHALSARGEQSQTVAISYFQLDAPAAEQTQNNVQFLLTESGNTQGSTYTFEGTGYDTSEPVALWLTLPDGKVRDLQIVKADDTGTFSYRFTPAVEDPTGTYHITGFGRSSERTGIVSFDVAQADYLSNAEAASLEIWPAQVRQLDIVTMTGRGFAPGELVSLWLTLPDGSVVRLYEGVTESGAFQEEIYLPAVIPEGGLPAGHHNFSAYGNTSGRRAITTLELLPGSGL
jgi:hypothetical protein